LSKSSKNRPETKTHISCYYLIVTMSVMTESYDDVANQALEDLRDEVGRPKIENKKITIYT